MSHHFTINCIWLMVFFARTQTRFSIGPTVYFSFINRNVSIKQILLTWFIISPLFGCLQMKESSQSIEIQHLARCATQDLYNSDTPDMNKSLSWSLLSLSFLCADLARLDIWISDRLTWILAFPMAKHDTTSTIDAFDFSVFWTCSSKATTNDCMS